MMVINKKYFKNILLLLGYSVCTLVAIGQSSYHIDGKFTSDTKDHILVLSYRLDHSLYSDTILLTGQSFSFKGRLQEPVLAQIKLVNSQQKVIDRRSFYLFNEVMELGEIDTLKGVDFSFSPINVDFSNYLSYLEPAEKIIRQVNQKWTAASPEERKKEEFFYELQKLHKPAKELKRELQKQYIQLHPKSFFSLLAVTDIIGPIPDIPLADTLLPLLDDEISIYPSFQKLLSSVNLARMTSKGSIAPSFQLPDTTGQVISLADFRGKYVLVDFWASWCAPCRSENPHLVEAYSSYKEKGFEILGVSLDEEKHRNAWLKAIKEDKLTWPQVSDLKGWKSQAALLYNIQAIPQNFLLDPNGKIIARNLRGDALHKALSALFD